MEEDIFCLVDRNCDGFVTLCELLELFVELGFMQDCTEDMVDKQLSRFSGRCVELAEFRTMVNILSSLCGLTLGSVWSVCVEHALYAAFCANATFPERTVPYATMELLEKRILEHSGTVQFAAAELKAQSAFATSTPRFLEYGDFVEYFHLKWPQMSRAKVASLLLYPSHVDGDKPRRSIAVDARVVDGGSSSTAGVTHERCTTPQREDQIEQLLKYAAALKATLQSQEKLIGRADDLEVQNAILHEALAVAKEEHICAQGEIHKLSRELREATFSRWGPADEGDSTRLSVRYNSVNNLPHSSATLPQSDEHVLCLLRRFCTKQNQVEAAHELRIREDGMRFATRHEFLRRWEEVLLKQESDLIRRELDMKKRWSEAFARKERQLQRLQDALELKKLELAAREAALEKRRICQLEREREAGSLSVTERRRRLEKLQCIEDSLRSLENQQTRKNAMDTMLPFDGKITQIHENATRLHQTDVGVAQDVYNSCNSAAVATVDARENGADVRHMPSPLPERMHASYLSKLL